MKNFLNLFTLFLIPLLLLCLVRMPYGYYTLIRFLVMAGGIGWAVRFFREERVDFALSAALVALLFNPIWKVALGRGVWNAIDVLLAILLVVLLYMRSKKKDK